MSESIKNLGEVNDLLNESTEGIRRPALSKHAKCLFAFLCVCVYFFGWTWEICFSMKQ